MYAPCSVCYFNNNNREEQGSSYHFSSLGALLLLHMLMAAMSYIHAGMLHKYDHECMLHMSYVDMTVHIQKTMRRQTLATSLHV